VLEGSVRKSGDRVRITAQLIDVSNGAHLWSETYDHTLTDIFAVQDQVASEILDALQIHVGVAPKRGRPTESTEAYSLFLKAKGEMNRWNPDTAEVLIMQALELDPEFAEAWETLAYAYWEQWGTSVDADTASQRVKAAASKALAINPNLIFAKYLLSSATASENILFSEISSIARVLRDEPNHGPAQELMIYYLTYGGYFGESLQMAERLVESDPLSPNALLLYNQLLFATGRNGEAYAALELADQINSVFSKGNLAFLNWEKGRYDVSLAYQKDYLNERSLPADWVDELHKGAIEPSTGQALLDRRIPEIVKTAPPDRRYEMNLVLVGWYLTYGFLDRYFEEIFDRTQTQSPFGDGEVLIFNGQLDRNSGFTAHPSYLQAAKDASLIDLWETRGPPDFCSKASGEWVCK
jgi:tetratricopeptide (TPR) repeat protein